MDQKNEYTVKDIAQLLSTNEETVRRWIRTGKLEADLGYGKQGHKISQEQLADFLRRTPKYGNFLAVLGLTVAAPALAPIAGAVGTASALGLSASAVGGLMGLILKSGNIQTAGVSSNHELDFSHVEDENSDTSFTLNKFFKRSGSSISSSRTHSSNEKEIKQLKEKIEETESRIYVCQMLMKTYETQIERCNASHKEDLIKEIHACMLELSRKIEDLTDLLKNYQKQLDIFIRLEE